MKKPLFIKLSMLILVILLNACVSRAPAVKEESPVPVVPAPLPTPPEIIISPMEQAVLRVKQNGSDIEKYFTIDGGGRIIVKALVHDSTTEYEVTYDLENMRAIGITNGSSTFEIDFTIEETGSATGLQDSLVWRPVPGKEGLLLAMDDDYLDVWEQYFDFFDRYNAKITFFIQGDPSRQSAFFGSRPSALILFAHNALARGHDVGYHTLNHLDLRGVTRSVFYRETIDQLVYFRQEGINVSSLAFPFGFSETWMNEILLGSFKVLRGYGTTFRLYTESEIRAGYISSRAIDNTVIQGDENFEKVILTMLSAVKFLNDGRILPLTTHDISARAAWGISPGRLEFLLQTASNLQLKFYRYCDFIVE